MIPSNEFTIQFWLYGQIVFSKSKWWV